MSEAINIYTSLPPNNFSWAMLASILGGFTLIPFCLWVVWGYFTNRLDEKLKLPNIAFSLFIIYMFIANIGYHDWKAIYQFQVVQGVLHEKNLVFKGGKTGGYACNFSILHKGKSTKFICPSHIYQDLREGVCYRVEYYTYFSTSLSASRVDLLPQFTCNS